MFDDWDICQRCQARAVVTFAHKVEAGISKLIGIAVCERLCQDCYQKLVLCNHQAYINQPALKN